MGIEHNPRPVLHVGEWVLNKIFVRSKEGNGY